MKEMPASFPDRDPRPNWSVLLSKFIPEAKRPGWPPLRRGSGQEAKSSRLFFLGQGWGGPFHTFQTQRDIGSVSQSTWEAL